MDNSIKYPTAAEETEIGAPVTCPLCGSKGTMDDGSAEFDDFVCFNPFSNEWECWHCWLR